MKVWGIDIGQSAVKGVLLEAGAGTVRILRADAVTYRGEPPKQKADPSRDKRMWAALKTFQERNKIKGEGIVVAIPSSALLINEFTVTPVGRRSLEELIAFEAQNQIPFVLEDVVWDYHLFPEAPEHGPERRGLLFAVKKASLANYRACFEAAGLPMPDAVIPAPLALLNFIKFETSEVERTILAIDVGAETTQILCIKGGRFWMRGLSAGGNRITASLQARFGMDFDAADNAKRNIGQSKFAEQILELIRPQIDSLVGEIYAAFNYMRSHGMEGDFEDVILTGGGSQLLGLQSALKRAFGCEPSLIEKFKKMAVSAGADPAAIRENLRALPVAVGCALHGAGLGAARVNLAESRSARIASATKRNPLWLAAAGVAFVSTLLLTALEFAERNLILRPAAQKTAPFMTEYTSLRNDERLYKGNTALAAEIDYLEAASRGRTVFLDAMSVFIAQMESVPAGGPRLLLKSLAVKRTDIEPGVFVLSFAADCRVAGTDSQLAAFNLINSTLVEPLRNRPDFLKYRAGRSQFSKGSDTVTGIGTQWEAAIAPGRDFIRAPDGAWHAVKAVGGNASLTISPPYEGESGIIPCAVSSARLEALEPKTLNFKFFWDMLVAREQEEQ